MTISHLLFAVATTGYILIAIWFEERDLVAHFGKTYSDYREQVTMLVQFTRKQDADAAYLRRQRG
jgi:protein-S-isoprenylcysteine O-methyltransferase Ste14